LNEWHTSTALFSRGTVSCNALDDSKQAYYSTYNPYMVETFVIRTLYAFRGFPL
jgi:hypothetical protein